MGIKTYLAVVANKSEIEQMEKFMADAEKGVGKEVWPEGSFGRIIWDWFDGTYKSPSKPPA